MKRSLRRKIQKAVDCRCLLKEDYFQKRGFKD